MGFFVFLNLKADWLFQLSSFICNRTQNDAIWELIALFLTNQIAGNAIDFKMNVINVDM